VTDVKNSSRSRQREDRHAAHEPHGLMSVCPHV
jgi:hypothetical protein